MAYRNYRHLRVSVSRDMPRDHRQPTDQPAGRQSHRRPRPLRHRGRGRRPGACRHRGLGGPGFLHRACRRHASSSNCLRMTMGPATNFRHSTPPRSCSAPCRRQRSPSSKASHGVAAARPRCRSTCASLLFTGALFSARGRDRDHSGRQRNAAAATAGRTWPCARGDFRCADIDAATAEAWGYLNRALPAGDLRPFVDALAAGSHRSR